MSTEIRLDTLEKRMNPLEKELHDLKELITARDKSYLTF